MDPSGYDRGMIAVVRTTVLVSLSALLGGEVVAQASGQRGGTTEAGRPFGSTGRDRPFGSIGRRSSPGQTRTFGEVGRNKNLGSLSDRPFGNLGRDRPFGGSDRLGELATQAEDAADRDRPRDDRRRFHVVYWHRGYEPVWESRAQSEVLAQPWIEPELVRRSVWGRLTLKVLSTDPPTLPPPAHDLARVAEELTAVQAGTGPASRGGRAGTAAPALALWSRAASGEWELAATLLQPSHLAVDPERILGPRARWLAEALERALDRAPDDRGALWLHASYHAACGNFAQLELDLRSLRQLEPDEPRLAWLEASAIDLLGAR